MSYESTAMLPEVVEAIRPKFSKRREDQWLLFDVWVKGGGFEELIDDISTGELSLQEHAHWHSVRPSAILKWIKEDPSRQEQYNMALALSADALMEETVRDARNASSIDQISLNKTQMIINAKTKLAKTRVAGFVSKPENNTPAALPPVYVQFVTTGVTEKRRV